MPETAVKVQGTFELERQTKNTFKYTEQGAETEQISGAFYLKKRGPFAADPPKTILVTVESK